MPELPEVETVKRTLADQLTGEKITKVSIHYPGNIRQPEPEVFKQTLIGKEFLAIDRRGKFLLLTLSEGYVLVVHLRMTGQLVLAHAMDGLAKHTHLVFSLSGERELRYADQRKFGTIDLVSQTEMNKLKGLSELGMEPLSPDFTAERLAAVLQNKKRPIKNLLLDQTIVAGIGNIYADEILFEAGIHPEKPAGELSPEEISALWEAVPKMLNLGIQHRGTSIRNYVDGAGQQGGFQNLLRVYGRQGEPCRRCGATIRRTKVSGRGTYFCPGCQGHVEHR